MFKGHPKGLYIAFFSNMGERFGFYTMMAILVLFLQAKYDLPADRAGLVYSVFYFTIYAMALVGGLVADRTQKYKGTIMAGIIVMLAGYLLLAVPGMGLPFALLSLGTIAIGNGLFKGNLQALVGQLYDAPQYQKLRDSAFSIFYMGINIGAFFAPSAARGVRSWFLKSQGLGYDSDLPSLCHRLLKGELADTASLQALADKAVGAPVADLHAFAQRYIDAFATGYNYAFGVAACAMLVSLVIYLLFKGALPDRKSAAAQAAAAPAMPWVEEKKRLVALGLVFLVVIFFWMSFHQNGLTMTYFARDYTVKEVDSLTNLAFRLPSLLAIIAAVFGLVLLVRTGSTVGRRLVGAALVAAGAVGVWLMHRAFAASNPIEPEIFQQFNPIFIVALTPIVVAGFAYLRSRNREPSTPRKIGIGMILAALGFTVMLVGSLGLLGPAQLAGQPSPDRVSPYWLISSYFVLTVAELFLSPMGISFVSKIAPPRFQGLMQGGWLGATAIGNQLLFVGSSLWIRIPVWQVWGVFVCCCLVSATFIFSIMRKLESATGQVASPPAPEKAAQAAGH